MAFTWLGEISSCSCLTLLPGPAWVLLSKIYKPFPGSLYTVTKLKALPCCAFMPYLTTCEEKKVCREPDLKSEPNSP